MSDHPKLNLTVRQIDVAGVVACVLLTALAYALVLRPVANDRSALTALRGEIASKDREKTAIAASSTLR